MERSCRSKTRARLRRGVQGKLSVVATLLVLWATTLLPLLHNLRHDRPHHHGPHGVVRHEPTGHHHAHHRAHHHGGEAWGHGHHHASHDGHHASDVGHDHDAPPSDDDERPTAPDHGGDSLAHFGAALAPFEAPCPALTWTLLEPTWIVSLVGDGGRGRRERHVWRCRGPPMRRPLPG